MSQTQATLNKLYEDYPHIDTILDIAQLYTDYQQKNMLTHGYKKP